MTYRRDIDGLRAIAVVAVVLNHAGVAGLGGGYVGVDVFFVISGYLITQMIAPDARARRFSIARFYERRIRRIAPAFFAMTAAASVAAWLLVPPTDLAHYGDSLMATSTFSSNLHFWRQEGYFDSAAHLKPMLHTWSLAVEEQFYIVYPLVLLALARWQPRALVRWLVVLAAASLAACLWYTAHAPRTAFYHTPLRGWELLGGALLALDAVPPATRRWQRELEAALGLLLIGWAIARFSDGTAFPGWHALFPCVGAALLLHAHAGGAPTAVGHALQWRPIAFLGQISYSLYLWHWPLIVFAKYRLVDPRADHPAAVLLATLVVSIVSWRFVEQPFRRPSAWATRPRLFAGMAIATALTFGFGLATSRTHGWPDRVSAAVRALDAAHDDFNHDRPRCHASERHPVAFDDKCVYGRAGVAPTLAIWGDSFAAELAVALGHEVEPHGSLLYVSYSSCPPSSGLSFATRPRCRAHNDDVLARLVASPSITKVILIAQYKRYDGALAPRFRAGFAEAATALARAGKRVFVVYPIPTPPGPVPTMLARYAQMGRDPRRIHIERAEYEAENRATLDALDALTAQPGITAVRPADQLCDATTCAVISGDRVLYWDDRHLSVTGATFLMPAFRAATEPP